MGLDGLLENQLGHWPKFQKLRIHSLSTPRGWNWAYCRSMGSGFRDTGRFKTCHIWAWNLTTGQSSRSCTYTLFLCQGVEIELIFALWSVVSQIRGNFLNCHMDMKLGHWANCQKMHITYFLSQEVKIELIFGLWAAVSKTQGDFQNCHIWAWNLAISSRSCRYILPQGVEIELIFALRTAVVVVVVSQLTAHQHQKGHTVPKQVIIIATSIQVATV